MNKVLEVEDSLGMGGRGVWGGGGGGGTREGEADELIWNIELRVSEVYELKKVSGASYQGVLIRGVHSCCVNIQHVM